MGHEPPPTAADMRRGIAEELEAIREGGRLRTRPELDRAGGRRLRAGAARLTDWASNDYLGLARDLSVRNGATRAVRRIGAGAGAARLLSGGWRAFRVFERAFARHAGMADCLLTASGYQANLAAVSALASSNEDVVVLDRLCHASLYDGAKLANATLIRFAHNDPEDLAKQLQRTAGARRRLVCVEAVYSMDGDEAPLAAIAAVCSREGALLLVDEAHSLGVFGPAGSGLCAELGLVPDVLTATCSKSLGSQGGLIAAPQPTIDLIVNRGRPFIFSTASVPAAVGAAHAALERVRARPQLREQLAGNARALRQGLRDNGWPVPEGRTPIIPVVVGDEQAALELSARLRAAGHHVPAIRPPTVPPGTSRVRLTVTAAHRPTDIRRLVAAFGRAGTAV